MKRHLSNPRPILEAPKGAQVNRFERVRLRLLFVFRKIVNVGKEGPKSKKIVRWTEINQERNLLPTRATTDISSAQADGSSKDPWIRSTFTSSPPTSLLTLLAAS